MLSRYYVFGKVIEAGSFTEAARQLNYSQSAVSQMVKSLESELGTKLVKRDRYGITLTADGEIYLPYIKSVYMAEEMLKEKKGEMDGLKNAVIRVGTFTSVSRTFLPQLMRGFKSKYPDVQFELLNGEYNSIDQWIREGTVDFGFINTLYANGLTVEPLYHNVMKAVLPPNHPLTNKASVTLEDMASEPFIELYEGSYSVTMEAFKSKGLNPNVEYNVQDDYSILTMVRQGLGVSMLYGNVIEGYAGGVVVRPIDEPPARIIALGCKNIDMLPLAARRFMDYISEHIKEEGL